jgi:radical SAM protein with 4Fe4S-binding SPASM domain
MSIRSIIKSLIPPATRLKLRRAAWRVSYTCRLYYRALFPDTGVMRQRETACGEVMVEPTNICNANCVFCAYQYQKRRKQAIRYELFEKVLKEFVAAGGGQLTLSVIVGDPLLDPDLLRKFQRARSEPAITNIVTITNCLNLHRIGAKNLLTSGVTEIIISTTGFDPAMYQRVYRSSHYEQMKQNVLDLLRCNHALGKPARITIALRIDRPPEEVLNVESFQEVKQLADRVDWAFQNFDSWSGRIKQSDLPEQMKLRRPAPAFIKKRIPCGMLWSAPMVLVDGSVTACGCRDVNADSDLILGNARDATVQDLWQSSRLKKIREDWFAGRNMPDICRDCTFWHPYSKFMLREFKEGSK